MLYELLERAGLKSEDLDIPRFTLFTSSMLDYFANKFYNARIRTNLHLMFTSHLSSSELTDGKVSFRDRQSVQKTKGEPT